MSCFPSCFPTRSVPCFARRQPSSRLLVAALVLVLICATALSAATVEGFAEPYREIDVSAGAEAGVITQLKVTEGDQVSRDELVATLDTDVLAAALEIARRRASMHGRIDVAKAELNLRRQRTQKLRALHAKGHASPVELERAEADLAIAQANLVTAEEERELSALECRRIEAQIKQRHVRSPIDGVVTRVWREAGEATLLSEPKLMTLVQLHPLRVKFPVSVDQASQLKAADTVSIELPELAVVTDALVEVVAPVLDAKSGTIQVTCVIDNAEGTLRSGMRCLLRLSGGSGNFN